MLKVSSHFSNLLATSLTRLVAACSESMHRANVVQDAPTLNVSNTSQVQVPLSKAPKRKFLHDTPAPLQPTARPVLAPKQETQSQLVIDAREGSKPVRTTTARMKAHREQNDREHAVKKHKAHAATHSGSESDTPIQSKTDKK